MAEKRDPNETVPLMLRIREDLRQELEQSAKMRRVSLNQECIDRLAYVRDRKGLLAEVMRLAFGERLAGLLLAVGLAMRGVANSHHRRLRHVSDRPPSEWTEDPTIFNETVKAAVTLLEAARPKGGDVRPSRAGHLRARQVLAAVGDKGKARPMSALMPTLPAKEVDAIKDLLGPVAQRMTYVHVRDALVLRISNGQWKPNAAIPKESDLAREFDVSPDTIGKALDLMEGEGLLSRRSGEAAIEESDKTKAKRSE